MLLIARTDSESGKLISSNVDIADHAHILGTTKQSTLSLAHVLSNAEARGASAAETDTVEREWTTEHVLVTFDQGMCTQLICDGYVLT